MLARQGKYNDVIFHRLIPNFMVRTFLLPILDLICPSRRKLGTQLALGPVESRIGKHLSETSMTIKVP